MSVGPLLSLSAPRSPWSSNKLTIMVRPLQTIDYLVATRSRAVVMGIGMALLEHTSYDRRNGAPINSNLADYVMAVNADVPMKRATIINMCLVARDL